jgi:hypothetical protein
MDGAINERRRARRWPADAVPWSRVRLRPGRDAALVNLCQDGVLIEGSARLHPGVPVVLQLIGPSRSALLTGTVVRCHVSAIDAQAGVRYRGAISFDAGLDLELASPGLCQTADTGTPITVA